MMKKKLISIALGPGENFARLNKTVTWTPAHKICIFNFCCYFNVGEISIIIQQNKFNINFTLLLIFIFGGIPEINAKCIHMQMND